MKPSMNKQDFLKRCTTERMKAGADSQEAFAACTLQWDRLTAQNLSDDDRRMELSGQICPVCANMYRTTLNDLAYTLENLGEIKPVKVAEPVRGEALLALEKMLEIA